MKVRRVIVATLRRHVFDVAQCAVSDLSSKFVAGQLTLLTRPYQAPDCKKNHCFAAGYLFCFSKTNIPSEDHLQNRMYATEFMP